MSVGTPAGASVAGVLADGRRRWLLRALADAGTEPQSTAQLLERATGGEGPRAVREALQSLRGAGVVREVPSAMGGASRWTLEPAGTELASLARVLTRVSSQLLRLPAGVQEGVRDEVARRVMATLSDPVVVATVRALVVRPRTPCELEQVCESVAPRRTVYRRLSQLVEDGAVERHIVHEVPRRTRYEIADQWRPAALMLLLATWWEWRHADPAGEALSSDLEALVHAVAPLATPPQELESHEVRWVLTRPHDSIVLLVGVRGGRLSVKTIEASDAARTGDAEVVGDAPSWCAALVTRDGSAMTVRGDRPTAAAMTGVLRSVLLAPLRDSTTRLTRAATPRNPTVRGDSPAVVPNADRRQNTCPSTPQRQ